MTVDLHLIGILSIVAFAAWGAWARWRLVKRYPLDGFPYADIPLQDLLEMIPEPLAERVRRCGTLNGREYMTLLWVARNVVHVELQRRAGQPTRRLSFVHHPSVWVYGQFLLAAAVLALLMVGLYANGGVIGL